MPKVFHGVKHYPQNEVFRHGSGVPSNGIGVDGGYYLDLVTKNLYYKSSGTWSIIASL